MEILLLRHAVTAETGRTLSGRLPDIHLSVDGVVMAEELRDSLAGRRIAAVYSSPIERCRETAAIVARPHDTRVRIRKGLVEADYGAWSGRPLASLRRLKAWQRLMAEPVRFRFPDGESLREVQARAVGVIEEIVAAHRRNDLVALCSHADVIRVVLAHHLGMPLDLVHRLDVRPASISVLQLDRDGRVGVPIINAPRMAARR